MTGWKRLSRKVIYETKFLRLYEDTVQLPGGDIIDNYSESYTSSNNDAFEPKESSKGNKKRFR